tara:strand:- start:380 stop:574 length:195 start_codon:yes stop_codon:yes gene_type:complete
MTKNEIKEIALNNGDLDMDNLKAISGLDEESIRDALIGTWHQYGVKVVKTAARQHFEKYGHNNY